MDQPIANNSGLNAPIRFSTQWLPERDRLDIWREEFSKRLVRLEIDPINDEPLYYDLTYHALGEVSVATGKVSAISCLRSRKMLADGNGDIVMLIPKTTTTLVEQGRNDALLLPGDCLVRRSSEIGRTTSNAGHFYTLTLPIDRLSERLSNIDRLSMTILRSDSEALNLLIGYCETIASCEAGFAAETSRIAGAHLLDLASLAIGATRDAWLTAQDRGLRAARRMEAKTAIRKCAADPNFRIAKLAAEMKVSESYLRKLFAEKDETFSALLREARLALAWNRLTDHRYDNTQISQIVFACGFGDVSYFNRMFCKRFDMTPTQARQLRHAAN